MSKVKYIKWLYEELPGLVSRGILPEDSAHQLRAHYGEIDDRPAYNIALILAAILGAVLIGGGIILLFAHNWDQFSRPVRTVLSFAPLVVAQVIYGYVFFKKENSTAWVEASSAFLMLMLAACIALISQTYHIQGDFEDFLLVWMLLSIPLLYLMNATLPALFYLIGISSWALNVPRGEVHWYWLLLLAVVPHLLRNMYLQKNEIRARLLGWTLALTFIPPIIRIFDQEYPLIMFMTVSTLVALFYLFGERIFSEKENLVYKPFQFVAVAVAFIMLMFLGYDWPAENFRSDNFSLWGSRINIAVLVLSVLGYLWLLYADWKEGRRINYFVMLFPVVIFIGELIAKGGETTIAIVLANVYLFGFGIYYIKYGIEKHRLSLVNLGMFFISALIIARFFDTDWGFVVKGLVFILLGIGFLWVNLVMSKRLKAG